LGLRNFVLVKLANLELYLVRMGRERSKVVKDEQFDDFKHVCIQWWVLVKKESK
jgi:hypothetical protein